MFYKKRCCQSDHAVSGTFVRGICYAHLLDMLNKKAFKSRITVLESAKNSICEENFKMSSAGLLVFYWPGMISSSGTALCSSLMLSSNVLFHCCFVSNSHAVTLWWSDLLEPVYTLRVCLNGAIRMVLPKSYPLK